MAQTTVTTDDSARAFFATAWTIREAQCGSRVPYGWGLRGSQSVTSMCLGNTFKGIFPPPPYDTSLAAYLPRYSCFRDVMTCRDFFSCLNIIIHLVAYCLLSMLVRKVVLRNPRPRARIIRLCSDAQP